MADDMSQEQKDEAARIVTEFTSAMVEHRRMTEQAILALLLSFERFTGLQVEHIDIKRYSVTDGKGITSTLANVRMEVRLP